MQNKMAQDYYPEDQNNQGYSGYGVPQQIPQGKAELLDKIKPEAAVESIRERLLGKEYIGGEWKPVLALKNRKLSEIGAWEISNLMLGISSINITVSKLNQNAIRERLKRIAKTAMKMMVTNWIEYDVKNISQFDYVYQIVFSNTLAVLNQADDASIQDLLKATVFENRQVSSHTKERATQKISRVLGLGE
jgi:hypothetical protein